MPIKIFTFLFILVSCIACNQPGKKQVPKVLENKKTAIEKSSKRGEEDLVDGLYNEAVDENELLKTFESEMEQLNKSKTDSLSLFGTFDSQNRNYYSSASGHARGISDSILKSEAKMLIASSLAKYDSVTKSHDSLLKNIMAKEVSLKDLQKVLKIVYTLPMIEKYQEENLPSPAQIEGFSARQNELIKMADTLKKNSP